MFRREREQWMNLLAEEREAHRKERQELLNRIAHPERVIVDAQEPVVVEPPRDAAELAFIGREVPDGHSLGELRDVG